MKRSALSTGFASDCRGNVAMLYALMLPALIFGAGFAIDYTHAMQVQTKLNAIADSAALVALTPGMMNKTNDVAKAAATNMFTSQAAAIASLDMNRTTVSVTVSNPSNNSLVRTAVVSYAGANRNIFAGILGYSALRVSGVASANASLAANIDFYLLLDNSPSMALPATQSGINSMISHTPQQGNGGGCVFACHQANTGAGNPNTAGNPYWNPNKTSQICTGAPSGKRNDPNVGCEQMDNYQLARSLSIPLRIDEVGSGVTALMATAQQTQAQSPQAPPPAYRFAANAIDASNARGFTNLMALSSNYAPAWAAAASKLQLMQMWDENVECAPSGGDPCGAPGTQSNDTDTDLDAALTSANSRNAQPGQWHQRDRRHAPESAVHHHRRRGRRNLRRFVQPNARQFRYALPGADQDRGLRRYQEARHPDRGALHHLPAGPDAVLVSDLDRAIPVEDRRQLEGVRLAESLLRGEDRRQSRDRSQQSLPGGDAVRDPDAVTPLVAG